MVYEPETSQAEVLILLGDSPIYWFTRFFDKRFSKLSQYGETNNIYGRQHPVKINNRHYNLISLCHPRQADRLGNSNAKWGGYFPIIGLSNKVLCVSNK